MSFLKVPERGIIDYSSYDILTPNQTRNPNRIVGILATNVQYVFEDATNTCYYGDCFAGIGILFPFYISSGTNTPSLTPIIWASSASLITNYNTAIFASEVSWDDLGTGLMFDDPNNAGIWQRFGGAGAAAFYPAIAFDDFVGTDLGDIPENDFVNGWAIDAAYALIKWESGFKFHALP